MKKLLLFFGIVLANICFGQEFTGITVGPVNNANVACAGNSITVTYSSTGSFSSDVVFKLFRLEDYHVSCFPYGGGGGTSSTEILSQTSSANSASFTIPSSVLSIGDQFFGSENDGYCFRETTVTGYKIVVQNNSSNESFEIPYSILSTSDCGPIRGVNMPDNLCQGSSAIVSYILDGDFASDNVFTCEFDDNEYFDSPTTIGTLASAIATSFPITIPTGIYSGRSYFIRIKASKLLNGDPFVSPNSIEYNIGVKEPYIGNSYSTVCQGQKLELSFYKEDFLPLNDYEIIWKKNGQDVNSLNQNTNNTSGYYYYYTRNISQLSDAGDYTVEIKRLSDACQSFSELKNIGINTPPNPPTTVPITVKYGNSAELTATGCSSNVRWYDSPTSDNYISYNNTFTTPELTEQKTYYAACQDYCLSERTPLVVSIDNSVNPDPPILTASNNNYCQNYNASTIITATGCSGSVRWWNSAGGTYYLQEDLEAPYEITVNPYGTVNYYADCRENGYLSQSRSFIEIIIKNLPDAPTLIANGFTINSGSEVSFSLMETSCIGGVVEWYDDYTAGNLVHTGRTLTLNNYTSTVYYYTQCTLNSCNSTRSTVYAYVSNFVVQPKIIPESSLICGSGSILFSALGCTNGTVAWQNSWGSPLATGQTYQSSDLEYVENSNEYSIYSISANCTIGGNTSTNQTSDIYVFKNPSLPSANEPTILCNNSAILEPENCNGFVRWYDSNDENAFPVEYQNTFTTPILTESKTYFLECLTAYGNCKSNKVPIQVTVTCSPPTIPIISANSSNICLGTGINLEASNCNGMVVWSDGITGQNRTNVIFEESINLSAICKIGNLESNTSNTINVIVNPKPSLIITNPASVSPPNTVNITQASVTAGSTLNGATLSYHSDAAGNVTLTSPPPNAINVTGTYYIKALTTAGCADLKPVVVVISDCGTALVLQSTADDYNTGNTLKKTNETITASNKITGSANVVYRSNKSITLEAGTIENPGFKADVGVVFKAEIGGCN